MNCRRIPGARHRAIVAGLAGVTCVGSLPARAALPTEPGTVTLVESGEPIPCVDDQVCSYSSDTYATARIDGCVGDAGEDMVMVSGDLDGDSYLDIVVAFPRIDLGRGRVYVYYGNAQPPAGEVDLCADSEDVVTISGENQDDRLGFSLAIGEVAEGNKSLVIGAPGRNDNTGTVYVLLGGDRWPSVTSISELPKEMIVPLDGDTAGMEFGAAVASADVAVDSAYDYLIGAPGSAQTFVVFGPIAPGEVASSGGDGATVLSGAADSRAGGALAAAGDLNGDGAPDFIVGASDAEDGRGTVYLVAGRDKGDWEAHPAIDLTAPEASDLVYTILGDLYFDTEASPVGRLGAAVAGVGDTDGDDLDDVVVGAPGAPVVAGASAQGEEAGRVYVVSGAASLWTSETAETTALSTIPTFYFGGSAFAGLGATVSAAGDVDGDGFTEFLAGALEADTASPGSSTGAGEAYLLAGRPVETWPELEAVTGQSVSDAPAMQFVGAESGDAAGNALFGDVSLDLDDDGFGDFFIAATGADPDAGSDAGRIFYYSFRDFYDADGDGQTRAEGDCDDSDTDVSYDSSGESEACDGKDNDCDGLVDDEDDSATGTIVLYGDADDDGSGDASDEIQSCSPRDDYVEAAGDCNDEDASTYPGADELCDDTDHDCDEDPINGFDSDGDGHASIAACGAESGTDCDDQDAQVYPGAAESCDGVDTDCDGQDDEDFDSDGDGYADAERCSALSGVVALDCDDALEAIHPGAPEIPGDGVDDDCDGSLATEEGKLAVDTTLSCAYAGARPGSTSPGALVVLCGTWGWIVRRRTILRRQRGGCAYAGHPSKASRTA